MQSSRPRSLFQDIRSREINGLRVRKRPYFDINSSNPTQIGAVSVVHAGECTLPLAVSFCKNTRNAHILAVSDEYGCVNVYNTSRKLTQFTCYEDSAEKARVCEWVAHQNSIFDVCWIKEDTSILTASGDQTIKVWDTQEQKCCGVLTGHVGSVKSLCPHPTNPDLIVSGSRDGSFALWDLRCNSNSKSSCCEVDIRSTAMVKRAHILPHGKRVRQGKAASMSITSVLYLKDEVSLATAGAVDNILKFWDTRNLKSLLTQTCPHQESSTNKERRLHGISSLSQDSNGLYLSASCRDNRIYMYDVLSLERGPFVSFSGSQIGSFFVKSTISPDGAHILSGSSDGNAYIWQVNNPNAEPIALKGHDGEVSSVDWSSFEDGKAATSSDDFTVRFWDIENSHSSTKSPSAIRRRVMALPSMQCRRLFNDEEEKPAVQTKTHESLNYISNMECRKLSTDEVAASETENHGGLRPIPSDETLAHQLNSPKITAPESQQLKLQSADLSSIEALAKTPEAAVRSPSSVLSPPSTRKKTIRDYFLSAS